MLNLIITRVAQFVFNAFVQLLYISVTLVLIELASKAADAIEGFVTKKLSKLRRAKKEN